MGVHGKCKTIVETLRQEILSGKFAVDRKLPSDRMLMRRFHVARATVQAAMQELMDKQLISRRPGYGTFLSDRAEISVAKRFGVVVTDLFYPFYMRICSGIEKRAREAGWTLLTATLGKDDVRERAMKAIEFAEVCSKEHVSGVFFQPLQFWKDSEKFNREILNVFKAAGIPVVLLDSDFVAYPNRSEYDLVAADNLTIGYELGRHLIAQGAKRIIYFTAPFAAPSSLLRGQGVAMAATGAGLAWRKDNIVVANPREDKVVKKIFASRRPPDAIVASNDGVAEHLLKTLARVGVHVPEDCLVAGVNAEDFAAKTVPPLTTGVVPCEDLGVAAVEVMTNRLANPSQPRITLFQYAGVILRESSQRKKSRRTKGK